MAKTYEIRDPVHGFVVLNEWEREIVDHWVFQRLRRIRQLSMTDMVYPSAMHTRFEHSLGVMHIATRMFDRITRRRKEFLINELNYDDAGLSRDRVLVRIAALLHDVGHAPFSHAGEGLMQKNPHTNKSYKHENYSAAAVLHLMRDVIENHPFNQNYNIKAEDVADFLNGNSRLGRSLLWRYLVSSQLDADRADYLLRDSHHIGVNYGKYDLDRILVTLTVAMKQETQDPVLAVEEGGEHAAEALILARYMLFTQVYFQHTRRAYDIHSAKALKALLKIEGRWQGAENGFFPPPDSKENMEQYLAWDDWRVLGLIHSGSAGEHGRVIQHRSHHRSIFETPEVPDADDLEFAEEVYDKLGDRVSFVDTAESSWYKFEHSDIPLLIRPDQPDEELITLSKRSAVVRGLKAVSRTRIYVPLDKKDESRDIVFKLRKNRGEEK